MGKRSTVYNNNIVNDEMWAKVNPENKRFVTGFSNYCTSNDKSPQTIYQYEQQLRIFFCWVYKTLKNKSFVDLKKRDFVDFFGYGRSEMGWSPNRLASFRAVLSSLSNYIERILDDEYPYFKNIIKVLEPIHVEVVREKTIISAEDMENMIKQLLEDEKIQEACWLALMFSSGMRKSEIKQTKISFFDEKNVVFDGLMYKTPKIRTKGRGKNGKQISRYIFRYTFDPYLKAWLEKREELGIKSEYLFVTKRSGEYVPADIGTFNSWGERVSKMANIDFYGHCVRHAWCTNLSKRGYPKEIIQKLQNWASIDMVDIYDDTDGEDQLDRFFKALNGKGEE